jgi:RHS repeat-associated protein
LTNVSQGSQTRTFGYDSLGRLLSATNPECGTINYQYDANGNLIVKTDARNVSTHYSYDALNRMVRRWYNGSSSAASTINNSPALPSPAVATDEVNFTYDAAGVTNSKGRLTSVSSSVSTTNTTGFDALGRIISGNQVTDGQTYSMSYGYNRADHQTSTTYPSGRVIKNEYDLAGRLVGVREHATGSYYAGAVSTDETNRVKYAPHGSVKAMKLGNGLWEHTDFNSRMQPTLIGLGTSSTDSSTLGLSYSYGTTNNNGNVLSASYSGSGLTYTQTFGYDALNRLTTSSESGSSWSQPNGYDRYGNRWVDLGGGNHSLNFNTQNRITNGGYAYDAAGNLTSDGVQTHGFDAENKIRTVNGISDVYRYDGEGNRVRKNFSSGDQLRMVYSAGQLIAEYDLSNGSLKKEYVYGPNGLVATIEPALGTKYATADHLGSPRVITSPSGVVVSRHDYKPFGEEVGAGIGGRTIAVGFSVIDGVRQKFTAYERDNETNLDYAHARYYSSVQGRFTSVDPLMRSASIGEPQTFNRYSYVLNNPMNSTDPTGLCPKGRKCYTQQDGEGKDVEYYDLEDGTPVIVTHTTLAVSLLTTSAPPGFEPIYRSTRVWQISPNPAPAPSGRALVSVGRLLGAIGLILTNPISIGCGQTPNSVSDGSGGCMSSKSDNKPDTSANEKADQDSNVEPTPETEPSDFEPVKGRDAKRNKKTKEIWAKDRFHKDHYEVYKNLKKFEQGTRSRTVWSDGRPKQP